MDRLTRPNLMVVLFASLAVLVGSSARAAPDDVIFERPEGARGVDPAVFPHWVHRIRYTCSVCHPGIFPMKRGETPVSMKSINAGEHCGKCHNGRIAFPTSLTTCVRCHYVPAD